jgi:hypothetical protein
MPYDHHLADRVGRLLAEKRIAFAAKAMMSGLCFMGSKPPSA